MKQIIIDVTEAEFRRYNPNWEGVVDEQALHHFAEYVEGFVRGALHEQPKRMFRSMYIKQDKL